MIKLKHSITLKSSIYENTINKTLPFLGCFIKINHHSKLQTKICRTKTHAGQYIYYSFSQPECVKISKIKKLVRRATIFCSTQNALPDELDYINKTMQLNDYPKKLIRKTTKTTLLSNNTKSQQNKKSEFPNLFIPY